MEFKSEMIDQDEKEMAADIIVMETLVEIARKNGTGEKDTPGKSYHNLKHAQYVIADTLALIRRAVENGKPVKSYLGKLAAAGHDEEQDMGRDANERKSADLQKERMVKAGFSPEDIYIVEDAIMGTRVTFESDGMRQYPNKENYLSLILADADLANLGGPTEFFEESTVDVMLELNGDEIPSLEKQIEFWESNVELLSTHEYYTEEARSIFNNQKANLARSQEILDQLRQKL